MKLISHFFIVVISFFVPQRGRGVGEGRGEGEWRGKERGRGRPDTF